MANAKKPKSKKDLYKPIFILLKRSRVKIPIKLALSKDMNFGAVLNAIIKHYKLPSLRMPKRDVIKLIFKDIIDNGSIDEFVFKKIASAHISKYLQDIQKKKLKQAIGRDVAYENLIVIGGLPGKKFYNSPEWRGLRYLVLEKYGNECMCCGSGPKNGKVIHVDHIRPRSLYPEFALDFNNLQILCEDCNIGKSNKFEKDWRVPNEFL